MVLTKSELIGALQNEVRILVHLAGKVDRTHLDYRPTPQQRSTLELLQYLTIMGPELIKSAKAGAFDTVSWTAAEQAAAGRDFDQTVAAIGAMADGYAALLADVSEEAFRAPVTMFGHTQSLGAVLVSMVLSGHAAYRTQLFLYLKSCGRSELSTMNLWAGIDQPAA